MNCLATIAWVVVFQINYTVKVNPGASHVHFSLGAFPNLVILAGEWRGSGNCVKRLLMCS